MIAGMKFEVLWSSKGTVCFKQICFVHHKMQMLKISANKLLFTPKMQALGHQACTKISNS